MNVFTKLLYPRCKDDTVKDSALDCSIHTTSPAANVRRRSRRLSLSNLNRVKINAAKHQQQKQHAESGNDQQEKATDCSDKEASIFRPIPPNINKDINVVECSLPATLLERRKTEDLTASSTMNDEGSLVKQSSLDAVISSPMQVPSSKPSFTYPSEIVVYRNGRGNKSLDEDHHRVDLIEVPESVSSRLDLHEVVKRNQQQNETETTSKSTLCGIPESIDLKFGDEDCSVTSSLHSFENPIDSKIDEKQKRNPLVPDVNQQEAKIEPKINENATDTSGVMISTSPVRRLSDKIHLWDGPTSPERRSTARGLTRSKSNDSIFDNYLTKDDFRSLLHNNPDFSTERMIL